MELVFHGCSISMIRHFTRKNEFYDLISIACDACLTNPKQKSAFVHAFYMKANFSCENLRVIKITNM